MMAEELSVLNAMASAACSTLQRSLLRVVQLKSGSYQASKLTLRGSREVRVQVQERYERGNNRYRKQ